MLESMLQDFIARLAVPGVLGVAGLITIAQYLATRRRHRWPSVSGRVLASEVSRGPRPGAKTQALVFWPRVRVDYAVGGKEYQTERITSLPIYYSSEESAAVVGSVFRTGEEVPVYYNPEDPSDSYLVPGGALGGGLLLLLGLALLVVCVGWSWWLFLAF